MLPDQRPIIRAKLTPPRIPRHTLHRPRLNDSAPMMRLLDWFIGRAPPHLHILLAVRLPLQLPHLLHWRVRGELQEIGQADLAFNALKIARLFGEHAGAALTPAQSEQIAARTEGWAIALSLILRQLTGRPPVEFADALARLSADEGDLFSYLAHEVLADLPEDVRAFMRVTSILRELDAPACDYLRRQRDSDAILRHLEENSLFVIQLGPGQLRYHPLFRDLLSSQLSQLEAQAAHNRAAAYYRVMGDEEAIIHHLLAAGSFAAAAELISEVGRKWVRRGRLDMLTDWIAALPPEILESRPMLLSLLGDVARLHSHFEEALAWYQQAEARARAQHDLHTAGQALRGQARVYLDTVNPSKADELLQEALRLSDGQESRESRAHLLELLAENLLNRGQMEAARRYQEQARTLPATRSDKKPAAIRPLA